MRRVIDASGALRYARAVQNGDIVAGPSMRNITKSLLADIENADKLPYRFDSRAATRAVKFFESVLTLSGGDDEGKPFNLLPWQKFVIGSLFGFKMKDTGYRRFRSCYIEGAKGNGKALASDTPMLTANRGWTTHGDLRKGDFVFGGDGKPTKVIAVHEPVAGACYQLRFACGEEIVCHANHVWQTYSRSAPPIRFLANRSASSIYRTRKYKRTGAPNHFVPASPAIPGVSDGSQFDWNAIEEIAPVDSVWCQCITVEADDGLYLAGKHLIPTHNSPLMAGIGMYMLVADGEQRSEVYVIAKTADQARVVFDDAVSMGESNPVLNEELEILGGNSPDTIAYHRSMSVMKRMTNTSHGAGSSGRRPHCVLIDEVHEHSSDATIRLYTKGIKNRRQPLIVFGTNSGESRVSVGYEYHKHAVDVASGESEDPTHLPIVFDADPDDDPFEDEDCWIKTNPSLPLIPGMKYLRDEVMKSQNTPSLKAITLRLNFSRWVDNASVWIEAEMLDKCFADALPMELLKDAPMFMGIDLSQTTDLTAVAQVWLLDGKLFGKVSFWVPEDSLRARATKEGVPYDTWRDMGVLNASEGRLVGYDEVAAFIVAQSEKFDLKACAYDQWRMDSLIMELRNLDFPHKRPDRDTSPFSSGVALYEHPQSFNKRFGPKQKGGSRGGLLANGLTEPLWMPGSINALEEAILNENMTILANPCLRWNILSAVAATDASDNRRFIKNKSKGRIDGLVALTMAVGLAKAFPARKVAASMGFLA